ncbi:MAG: hypothetical protein OXQ28_05480 [Acidobacteriota bacterium]|nr:hypothetical protein [Acidobacteriota bacterium]
MTKTGIPEPHLELIHVHHTETGLGATHATLTALAGWIQKEVDACNATAKPAPGELDAVENPLRHLLDDERTQMVRPAGRMELVKLLYAMSRTRIAGPAGAAEADASLLRRLAGELATTIRCLHHIRENDYILFVIE